MIEKFNTLYIGHVEMDNIGLRGTPVNDRWFPNEHLITVFDKATGICQAAERCGLGSFWLAEHHFQREGYECIPNILMLAVHLAHLTKQIKIGCAFNIVPMWHPLRLAEDYATADILTGGRVIFGVGRGYHTREVETFGAPMLDNDANRELFEEQLELIFKAFNEESFSHHGKHYDIPPRVPYRGYELEQITLVPRPKHLPVECWQPIVSATQRGMDFMAEHGIKGIIGGGAATLANAEKVATAWREAQARVGRETALGEDLIFGYYYHIGKTREEALAEGSYIFEEHMKMFGPLGFIRGLTEEQIRALANPAEAPLAGLPTIERAVASGGWLCGTTEDIIERLMEVQRRFPGLKQVTIQSALGAPKSQVIEQLEWFAQEVMPGFRPPEQVPAS